MTYGLLDGKLKSKAFIILVVNFRNTCKNRLSVNVFPLDLTFAQKVYLLNALNGPWK
jgi:hypothetical protein